jgi:hypothetical protein
LCMVSSGANPAFGVLTTALGPESSYAKHDMSNVLANAEPA